MFMQWHEDPDGGRAAESRALWSADNGPTWRADEPPHCPVITPVTSARLEWLEVRDQHRREHVARVMERLYPLTAKHVLAIHRRAVYTESERAIVRGWQDRYNEMLNGPLQRVTLRKEQIA